jgi:hypothetical protein
MKELDIFSTKGTEVVENIKGKRLGHLVRVANDKMTFGECLIKQIGLEAKDYFGVNVFLSKNKDYALIEFVEDPEKAAYKLSKSNRILSLKGLLRLHPCMFQTAPYTADQLRISKEHKMVAVPFIGTRF